MEDCIFCQVASGNAESTIARQTDMMNHVM